MTVALGSDSDTGPFLKFRSCYLSSAVLVHIAKNTKVGLYVLGHGGGLTQSARLRVLANF